MGNGEGPAPWPRLRDSWWVFGLALAAIGLFAVGFLVRLHCGLGSCLPSPLGRLLDLDRVGGLPRIFTAALFAASSVLAWRAGRSAAGRPRLWWTAVAAGVLALGVAKLLSAQQALTAGPQPVLQAGVAFLGTLAALAAAEVAGRRWRIAATRPVVMALAVYAATALGLDVVTGLLIAVQERAGTLSVVGATFVEELGEALAALLLLVVVRWQAPDVSRRGS